MLKLAICEDNPIHAQRISDLAKQLITVPFTCTIFSSGRELRSSCEKEKRSFDIICMDISLEKDNATGIQFAQEINLMNPYSQIIYISQYLEYASSVYETEHVYFIHKEQLETHFGNALQAAMKKLDKLKKEYLYFECRQSQYRILQSDILYMERILRTTEIHTIDTVYPVAYRFSTLMTQLSSAFTPCHRSFLVNLNAIKTLSRTGITLSNGAEIPIGRTYYPDLKMRFAKL